MCENGIRFRWPRLTISINQNYENDFELYMEMCATAAPHNPFSTHCTLSEDCERSEIAANKRT